jgi:hypothetical protein
MNIFVGGEGVVDFTSNLKIYEKCQSHHSRKLRADKDLSAGGDIFYYYFVGTDNNAYVSKAEMTSIAAISLSNPKLVIKGCDQSQDSFDLAEDKFLGYNVFTCVDYQYKTKIKIQLFKIEDENIIFYGNKNPNHFESFSVDNEVSMINFVVLKNSLDFGFLSYRDDIDKKAYYTIFNKPTCDSLAEQNIPLNTNKDIDFSDILDDNYGESYIYIFEEYKSAFEISKINDETFNFQSINDNSGYFNIKFQVRNNYFESDNCTIPILVDECHPNCKTCSSTTKPFLDQ